MPEFEVIEESTGRRMVFEGAEPPPQDLIEQSFRNYDAISVAVAGPPGSEARRRAFARESGRQADEAFTEAAGGKEAGAALSGLASLGRSLSEGGTSLMQGLSILDQLTPQAITKRAIGGMLAGTPEQTFDAGDILSRASESRLSRTASDLEQQAKAFYPVNPEREFANLPGQAVGSAATMLAAGPARLPVYALQAGAQGIEESMAAGSSPERALAQGAVQAATGVATERLLGLVPFLRNLESSGGLREIARRNLAGTLARTAGAEAVQEPSEGAINDLVAKYLTQAQPDLPAPDEAEFWRRRGMESLGGALGGIGIAAPTTLAARGQRAQRLRDIEEFRAGRDEAALNQEAALLDMAASDMGRRMVDTGQPGLVEQVPGSRLDQLNLEPVAPDQQIITSQVPSARPPRRPLLSNAERRRLELEAMILPNEGMEPEPVEQAVGQYPEEGFGTGQILSPEEEARRAASRQLAAERGRRRRAEAMALLRSDEQEAESELERLNRLRSNLPAAGKAPEEMSDRPVVATATPPIGEAPLPTGTPAAGTPYATEAQVQEAGAPAAVQNLPAQAIPEAQAPARTAQREGEGEVTLPASEPEWTDLYDRASREGLSVEIEMDGERSVQRLTGRNASLAFKRQKGTVDALNALLNCLNT